MNLLKVLGYSLLLLCIPLIGMIVFPDDVQWTVFDFVIAFMLLFFACFGMTIIPQRFQHNKMLYRVIIIFLILLAWIELAVGIFN